MSQDSSHASRVKSTADQDAVAARFKEAFGDAVQVHYLDTGVYALVTEASFSRKKFSTLLPADKLDKEKPQAYVRKAATSTWSIEKDIVSAAMASASSHSLDEFLTLLKQSAGFENATIRQEGDHVIIDRVKRDSAIPTILESNCEDTSAGLLGIEKIDKNALLVPAAEMHTLFGIATSQAKTR